ncbi:hypothetical protein [Qaidamihabitans albus]|uniref:hypothetical protein n=1 Tax=Qaidamihabitans albus TaxID=2795733 RepID=UPI0018F1DAB0|nr:hypothetical protein [Qaidamihabitans albus]
MNSGDTSAEAGTAATAHRLLSAALLAAGSGLVLWGAARYPAAGIVPPADSAERFQVFAENIVAGADWRAVHAALLAGPLLWALGAVALTGRTGFARTGMVALTTGAAGWAVALVLYGFAAPLAAESAAAAAFRPESLDGFRVTHEAAVRLGLVSWLLLGAGVAALSAAALTARRLRAPLRFGVGVPGVFIGLWPIAAGAAGLFRPGFFTGALWLPTAAVTAVWFVLTAAAIGWTSWQD